MDGELNNLLKGIKAHTALDVDVFSENMKLLASSRAKGKMKQPSRMDFQEVYLDHENGTTLFKFRFRKEYVIGLIKGVSEVEKNYAFFLIAYLENAVKEVHLGRSEYMAGILLGEYSRPQIIKFTRKYQVPFTPCFALSITVAADRLKEALSFLEEYNSNGIDTAVAVDETTCAFIKFTDEQEGEADSPTEFAAILARALFEETGVEVRVGVGGTVSSLCESAVSYAQGVAALRMSGFFNAKPTVCSYKEFMLIKLVEEFPKYRLNEFLDALTDDKARSVLNDADMMNTAEEFLNSGLNVSETSRKLFMHRNTLMYRLDKIERLTGLNIKNFSDAVTFRLITVLNKLASLK